MSFVQARPDGSCAPGYSKNINGWCYSLMQVHADPQQSGPVNQRRRIGAEKLEDQWKCILAGTPCNHGMWMFSNYPQQPFCKIPSTTQWLGQDNKCYASQQSAAQAPTIYTHKISFYGQADPSVPPLLTWPEAQIMMNTWTNTTAAGDVFHPALAGAPIVAQMSPMSPGGETPSGHTTDGITVSLKGIQLTQADLAAGMNAIKAYRQGLLVPMARAGQMPVTQAPSGIPTWAIAVAGAAAVGAAYYFLLYKK